MAKKRQGRQPRDGKTEPSGSSLGDAPGLSGTAIPQLPPWLPPSVFGALTVFLFRDFIFSDRMLLGSDTLGMGYVVRELYAEALHTLGRIPGWAPEILGGTPFLEALSAGDSLYPPSVLLLMLTEPYRALGWKLVAHVFMAGLFMFGWIRAIGGSRPAALLAGVAYLAAPFFVSLVLPGHDGKMFVTALAPLLFWATERHFLKPGIASISGIGLIVALVIYTTHFQMAYFLFGGVGLYGIFRAVQIARGTDPTAMGTAADTTRGTTEASRTPYVRAGATRLVLFLVASVLGATGAAYQFFPAADYVTQYSRRIQTTRETAGESGRAWSSSWSLHPEEVMSLVVPQFPGNAAGGAEWTNGTYWGRNVFKNNHEYAGLVVLLLASISFLGAARRGLRWFFVALGLTSVGFALGANTPVWGLFYDFLPGISLFRAPSQVIYLFGFSAVTLAALGLDRILDLTQGGEKEELARVQKGLWIGTAAVAVIALLLASGIFTSLWTSVVYRDIDAGRLQRLESLLPSLVQGASLAVILAAATSALVWGLAKGRITAKTALAGLVLLVAVDEARIDDSFIQTIDFEAWAAPDPNVQAILDREQDGEPYRLLSFVRQGQDVSPAMHGIELAAGHHPNDLSRYRELIGMVGSGLPRNLLNTEATVREDVLNTRTNVRRILNVEYILWPDIEFGPAPQGSVVSRTQYGQGQPYHTLLADAGLPRARLVASAVVKSDAEAVEYIMSPAHDPEVEAVLSSTPPIVLDGGPVTGAVTWLERSADVLRLSVESDRPALLIVADNWFPAWKAEVDGRKAEVLRAYHSLRAVAVPAGSSTVVMRYESTLLARSLLLSIIVLVGLLGGWVAGLWQESRAVAGPGTVGVHERDPAVGAGR